MDSATAHAGVLRIGSMPETGHPEFELLYAEQYPSVYALVFRLVCDPTLAEDVTQEVFVAVWRGIKNFRGESFLRTWIHTIAVRTAMRHWRRQPDAQLDDVALAKYERSARSAFPGARLELERAVAALPAGARAVLLLHDVYGYKHSEVSELLGVAVGTAKAQLHRARNLMKRELR